MKKDFFQYFMFLLISLKSVAQSREVKISGSVVNWERVIQPNVRVLLFENNDTLEIVETDANGEFSFISNFKNENDYFLALDIKFQNSKAKLHSKGDTIHAIAYVIDLMVHKICNDNFNPGVYYEFNETKVHTDFEAETFKQLLIENPGMCLLISQTINPEESKRIAKKRMQNFKRELFDLGVNLQQITFSDDYLTLNLFTTYDKRSRIEPVILSMDGNCK